MPDTESIEITCNLVRIYPSPTSMSLEVGERESITYTTNPSNHHPTVSYSSSDENVAEVILGNMDEIKVTITSIMHRVLEFPVESKSLIESMFFLPNVNRQLAILI